MRPLRVQRFRSSLSRVLQLLLIAGFVVSAIAAPTNHVSPGNTHSTPRILNESPDVYLPAVISQKTKQFENILFSLCKCTSLSANALYVEQNSPCGVIPASSGISTLAFNLIYTETTSSRL